jgi:hypothetical protein
MEKKTDNKANKMFQELFVETELKQLEAIRAGKKRYPELTEQQKRISMIAAAPASWRLIVDIEMESVRSVYEGDPYFPFSKVVAISELVQCIHPSYLQSFLLCAKTVYKFLDQLNITPEEVLDYTYQNSIPVKFPGNAAYCWYLQTSKPICVNENRVLLSHANTYIYEKDFNHFEYHLLQPSVLIKGKISPSLHEGLLSVLRNLITSALTEHEKRVLRIYAKQYKLKAVAAEMGTTTGTERVRSNAIMKKVKENTGFKFSTIAELADFFYKNDMLH